MIGIIISTAVSVIVLGLSITLISSITIDNISKTLGKMNNDIHQYKKDEEE